MNKMTIIIATRNRWDKLCGVLDSIDMDVNVVVMCDGDQDTYDRLDGIDVERRLSHEHIGSVACRNLILRQHEMDGCLYATDDIEFYPGALRRVFDLFNVTFESDDGVVGLVQDQSHHFTGVALVGGAFLGRYPDRQLFYPGYFHFAAQEILRYCKFLEEMTDETYFVKDTAISLSHKHPSIYRKFLDQTHVDAREHKSRDMKLMNFRAFHRKVWPIDAD